jgi:hypothetical protein
MAPNLAKGGLARHDTARCSCRRIFCSKCQTFQVAGNLPVSLRCTSRRRLYRKHENRKDVAAKQPPRVARSAARRQRQRRVGVRQRSQRVRHRRISSIETLRFQSRRWRVGHLREVGSGLVEGRERESHQRCTQNLWM